jgi:hypothetical protein
MKSNKKAELAGDLAGELAEDLVAKKNAIVAKMNMIGDIDAELPGALTGDLAGDLVAKKLCQCSKNRYLRIHRRRPRRRPHLSTSPETL